MPPGCGPEYNSIHIIHNVFIYYIHIIAIIDVHKSLIFRNLNKVEEHGNYDVGNNLRYNVPFTVYSFQLFFDYNPFFSIMSFFLFN